MDYPTTSPTSTVTLRNPEFGNVIRHNTNAENRNTLGGEFKSVKNADWPNQTIQVYTFKELRDIDSSSTLYLFKAFLQTTAGLEMKVTDHNGDVWHGYIITPVTEIITEHDNCSYTISFEFLGIKQ